MTKEEMKDLRNQVRFFYDLQRLRIQCIGRTQKKSDTAPEQLDTLGKLNLDERGNELRVMEAKMLKIIKAEVEAHPLWKGFLKGVKGCGPTMAGVILAELDPVRARTISSFWAYTGVGQERPYKVKYQTGKKGKKKTETVYGTSAKTIGTRIPQKRKKGTPELIVLDVELAGGYEAQRLRKGQYPSFNTFLKTKIVGVLGGCLVKAKSTYKEYYDNYKHRLQSRVVGTCMLCKGTGKFDGKKCGACGGKSGDVVWGRSDAHRHAAANRYAVKMFLKDLWLAWRKIEGLPVRGPYCEEYLGKEHAA